MSNTRDLLIELGTEELPPKSLLNLSTSFAESIHKGFEQAGLIYTEIKPYASPRRLALLVSGLPIQQQDKQVERRGPAIQASFDDEGNPTKAAEGFAKSCGVTVSDLQKLETDKGAWLSYTVKQKGITTASIIPGIVSNALDKLPIPKRMRWADLDAQFVRPVHWLVMLFGDDVIDCEILSVKSERETYGHRFHYNKAIFIPAPKEYEVLLESEGKVIADFNRRRETIRAQVEQTAHAVKGVAVIDDDLLDEVTAMVEWPVAVLGNFEKRFLEVPQETLISTMSANQKYFHVLDKKGKLLPHFITISNIESTDIDQVRAGNERVIRPRFADAEFFWKQDQKQSLARRVESLKGVVFQKQLGSLHDKTQRIGKMAADIATQIGGDKLQTLRAAELCKCDLMTEMVGEFPELQGIMGRYYATLDGESAEVATAIAEHYLPRFSGDQLAQTKTGQAIAITDRLDSLLGIIAIGQGPTGDKDPYGLRRAALGVLRTMIENNLNLDLQTLLTKAAKHYPKGIKAAKAVDETVDFIIERLKTYYLSQNVGVDVFEAVRSQRPTQPNDFDARIQAVKIFQQGPAAQSLAAANKRISNILKKNKEKLPKTVDKKLLTEADEQKLAKQLTELTKAVKPLIKAQKYQDLLHQLANLRDNVDSFFDSVMVMADDKKLRLNRLALLTQLRELFLNVADISQLQSGN